MIKRACNHISHFYWQCDHNSSRNGNSQHDQWPKKLPVRLLVYLLESLSPAKAMYSICMHTDLSLLTAFIPDTQGPWLSTHDRQLMMTTKVIMIMKMAINIITVVKSKLVILNHNGTSLIRIDENAGWGRSSSFWACQWPWPQTTCWTLNAGCHLQQMWRMSQPKCCVSHTCLTTPLRPRTTRWAVHLQQMWHVSQPNCSASCICVITPLRPRTTRWAFICSRCDMCHSLSALLVRVIVHQHYTELRTTWYLICAALGIWLYDSTTGRGYMMGFVVTLRFVMYPRLLHQGSSNEK